MSNSTKITIKRSTNAVENDGSQQLYFGEPLIIDSTNEYLVIGGEGDTDIPDSIFFKGMNLDQANHQVTYLDVNYPSWFEGDEDNPDVGVIISLDSTADAINYLKVKRVSTSDIIDLSDLSPEDAAKNYYILCQDPDNGAIKTFKLGSAGIYIDGRGVMHGAAWNDYAENRHFEGDAQIEELPGRIVCEDGYGNLKLSEERLQPCAYVVSDTYGMTIGEGNIHIAVAGKVLVCINDEVELGDCVTAGENGYASKMSRPEIINYPDRILGTVIETPENTKGKVWIEIK